MKKYCASIAGRRAATLPFLFVLCAAVPAHAASPAGWRTDGTGKYPNANPPLTWSAETNVIWKTRMPDWGNAAPAVADDRLFVCAEPATLLSVSLADGQILWQRTNEYVDMASPEEATTIRQAKQEAEQLSRKLHPLEGELVTAREELKKSPENADLKQKVETMTSQCNDLKKQLQSYEQAWYRLPATHGINGYTSPTPVTDGKYVYVVFGTGVVACYDRDGHRKWIKLLEKPTNGWGHSASPLLAGNRLLVHILHFHALDAATGEVLWKTRVPEHWGTSALAHMGDDGVVVTPGGDVLRLSDGKVLASQLSPMDYSGPVVDNGVVYFIQAKGKAVKLPAAGDTNAPTVLWQTNPTNDRYYASPICHDGLIYAIMQQGIFSVIDATNGAVVFEKKLGFGGGTVFPSICLASNRLFVSSDNGRTIVMEPGREPKEAVTNKIEEFRSTPVFVGSRIYIRGLRNLYCIGTTNAVPGPR